ncbi:MAG: hypothetical protein JWR67_2994 [Mucilaginibacter sp.]|nr:hypothetical protein [Mucilaginibacter sp.]
MIKNYATTYQVNEVLPVFRETVSEDAFLFA